MDKMWGQEASEVPFVLLTLGLLELFLLCGAFWPEKIFAQPWLCEISV